jgi:hypothetical protein
VGIPNHPGHTIQLGNLRRRTLRITAGDQNPAPWVGPVNAPDQLPGFGIRPGCDSAGVQNRHLACGNVPDFPEARFEQLLFNRSAVCLARAATEVEKLERRHGQRTILTEIGYSRLGKKPFHWMGRRPMTTLQNDMRMALLGNLFEWTHFNPGLPGWKCLSWN